MKKWLDHMFYYPKHMKEKDDNFIRLVAPSLVGAVICLACLAGVTWAWFGTSIQSSSNRISAASYDLTVIVNSQSEPLTRQDDGAYHINLEKNQQYEIKLTGSGNATVGYGEIKSDAMAENGKTIIYYTNTIKTVSATSSASENSMTITVRTGKDIKLVITPIWGGFNTSVSTPDNTEYRLLEKDADGNVVLELFPEANVSNIENDLDEQPTQQEENPVQQPSDNSSSVESQATEPTENEKFSVSTETQSTDPSQDVSSSPDLETESEIE